MPDLRAEDDLTLIQRSASGDRDAFEHLVERHQAAVYRFLRTIVRDPSSCEDALQETFLAVWRSASAFRGESSPRSWLLTIARNAAMRQHRRRAGEPQSSDIAPLDDGVSLLDLGLAAGWGSPIDPEAAAIRGEQRALIVRALDALEPEDRRVLVLRDLEQMTGDEAAGVLGLTLPALKSRLHRARLRFAAHLRKETAQ
ncbi:MAG: sigma-70 family RNA polymerase sigma factor [Vicinamibacterales bacterium]